MSTKPTLGYWDLRGFVRPIRDILHYAGIDFNDKTYPFGPGNTDAELDSIRQHWYNEKFSLGLDFPNLPYWMDGEVKLTQSIAILKYLARKYGLIASDVVTLAKQEMLEQQLLDYRSAFVGVCYTGDNSNYQVLRENYLKTSLPQVLESLDKYLGDNQWLTKDISYVDFMACEMLDWFMRFSTNSFNKFPRLKDYVERFESLPAIKAYHTSSEYKPFPIWAPQANWGHRRE